MHSKTVVWVEGTIIAALAMALSFIPLQTGNASFDLSLGLVPLVLYGYRRSWAPAMLSGFIWGLLNIILGSAMKNFVSVPQIIFEYPFAFAFGGMGGILMPKIQASIAQAKKTKTMCYIALGGVISAFSRWFWHFWAGVFVWGAYAPPQMSPYLYSFLANGASFLANAIYIAIVLVLLYNVAPSLFVPKNK